MRNLVAMRQMKTKLRCLKPNRPYTVDFAIDARERVKRSQRDGSDNVAFVLGATAAVLLRFGYPNKNINLRKKEEQKKASWESDEKKKEEEEYVRPWPSDDQYRPIVRCGGHQSLRLASRPT